MSGPAVTVSDHALLRYLERVKGVNVEALRAEIAGLIGTAAMLGAAAVVRSGHVFVVEGYCVTTVLPRGAHFMWPEGTRRASRAKGRG